MMAATYIPSNRSVSAIRADIEDKPVYLIVVDGGIRAVEAEVWDSLFRPCEGALPVLETPIRRQQPQPQQPFLEAAELPQERALAALRSVSPDGLTTHEAGDRLYPGSDKTQRFRNAMIALRGLRGRGLAELRECPDTRLDKWFAVAASR